VFNIDVVEALKALGLSKGDAVAAARGLLLDLISKRIDVYAELWDLVGDICPPKLMGGAAGVIEPLRRDAIHRIARDTDEWYRKNGVILDPVSRYWLIALRETLFSWLCIYPDATKDFTWHDDVAPRAWLIKTALRISLNRQATVPDIAVDTTTQEQARAWLMAKEEWEPIGAEIKDLLERNYGVVYAAWKDVKNLRLKETMEDELEALLPEAQNRKGKSK